MNKSSKHPAHRDTAFSLAVSNRIRELSYNKQKLESEREDASLVRDDVRVQIEECTAGEVAKLQRLHAEHSDVVLRIERLAKSIRWYASQLDRTVTGADEPELIETAPTAPPEELFRHKPKPTARREPSETSDKHGGVDQHLDASVRELDMREDLKGKLIAAGIEKVRDLVTVNDVGSDLADEINCSDAEARTIMQALKSYRTEHRRAARDAEVREVAVLPVGIPDDAPTQETNGKVYPPLQGQPVDAGKKRRRGKAHV